MSNKKSKIRSILFFNPWIYDFAAFDFWYKPLGLLYLAAFVRQHGYDVQLVDCMDRYHPALQHFLGSAHQPYAKRNGSGKFYRQEIAKPDVLREIPRKYCRYGMPPHVVQELLLNLPQQPDFIAVTSFMTYWYPGVQDAILMLRQIFPGVPIALGGIYASLCSTHAQQLLQPDYLIHGEGELPLLQLLNDLNGVATNVSINSLDELPFPAFDLYPELHSIALTTSRGCPNRCSFCASSFLVPHYRRRSPHNVLQELEFWYTQRQIRHVAFYDDALLHRRHEFIIPILQQVLHNNWQMNFYTPNGLTPRFVDAETAELFYAAGVQHVKLSFETTDPIRQRSMSAKVSTQELVTAIEHLEKAGYKRANIGVYLMMGLPGQSMQEVQDSVQFVHNLGVTAHVNSFSPIPGTKEWENALEQKIWKSDTDLLLTNTSIFPILFKSMGFSAAQEILLWTKELNAKLTSSEVV